ncbi:MAG: response regulator [Proteobacteria bacterium]|nr:response regulator [Pseudomonadota bacterium]MCP4468618.1 response regulator [Halieaceae bacterium]MCP4842230.1 response regulator [Halieaceae bacterium]
MNDRPRKTVLVVDDENYLTGIWQEILKMIDTDCVMADSGDSAISVLKDRNVDLIITDLRMRGSDGFVLLRYLKNEAPTKIPAAVCSGFYNENSEELLSHDVVRVISKPFDVREELDFLKTFLYG